MKNNNDEEIICCSPKKVTSLNRVFASEGDISSNVPIKNIKSQNSNLLNSYTPPLPTSTINLEKNVPPRPSSAPNIDLHDIYMERTQKTEKKLSDFFGDEPPFDISIKEIKNNGLKAILQSKVPICYFLYSLLENYSCENLFFYLEVLQFEKEKYDDPVAQQEAARNIFNTYLSRNSQIEINIDEKIHREISKFITTMTLNTSEETVSKCFKKARNSVLQLMEDCYTKFQKSSLFERMIREIGPYQIYSEKVKVNAVKLLKDYLDQRTTALEYSLSNDPSNPITITNLNRHRIIGIMTHEFSKSVLNMDFEDIEIENNNNTKSRNRY